MEKLLMLVNEDDEVIGYAPKNEVHKKGLLHRAFSVFIFDWKNKKMLLQKRADQKYHSGGLWTNACCSHPLKNERMDECLKKRIKDELGLNLDFHIEDPFSKGILVDDEDVIYSCGKFAYCSSLGEVIENEIDQVFLYSPSIGDFDTNNLNFNLNEVSQIRWVTIAELHDWLKATPDDFTIWFKPAFDLAYSILCHQARSIGLLLDY